MKSLNNIGVERLGDALGKSIDNDAKLSIISSYFTIFAYGELKNELSKIKELRFLFSEPTFIKRMIDSKEPGEFEVARRAREVGIGGSGLELTLRNNPAISNSRDDTIRRINSEFAEAEAYYDGEGAGNLLESHNENVWDE